MSFDFLLVDAIRMSVWMIVLFTGYLWINLIIKKPKDRHYTSKPIMVFTALTSILVVLWHLGVL